MDILKLMIVFGVLVVMLWLKRPLYQGILGAAAAVCILFGIAPAEAFNTALLSVTGWGTLSVLLVFYLITFLQRMLEKRDFLNLAQASLNGIFNNRRINASLAPVFIGLLPSAGELSAYIYFHYHCHKPARGQGERVILSGGNAAAGVSSGLSGIPVLPEKNTKGYGDAAQYG